MSDDKRNVADLFLDYLRREGVEHIFGVPGGGLIQMLQALYNADGKPRYIVCRQETGAAYMADGYYRASGRLGAVMVTTGPGATNALTGVMNAEAGGSAMLLLTGEIADAFAGLGYLQEGVDGKLDVNEVFRAAVAYSAIVSSQQNAATLVETALRTALGVPRHAAHLSLPVNVTMASLGPKARPMPKHPSAYRAGPPVAPGRDVGTAIEMLASSHRPLILLGNGCREALRDKATFDALLSFVETRGIPVMTTADGKGVFPEDHPLSLRAFGIASSMWPYYWLTQTDPAYDLLMVIGSGLGELATEKWGPILRPKEGVLIQLDADHRILARDYPVDLGIAGEAGDFIRRLCAESGASQPPKSEVEARKAKVAEIKKDHSPYADPAAYASDANPLHPAALCRVMQEVLPPDRTLVMVDAGNCVGWAVHYLVAGPDLNDDPGHDPGPGFEVHSSLDMGPMGFAVGAVVGAKLARREREDCKDSVCVALTGDGAFMMQGAEISTAARFGVGAIWIVLHDNDLAMVSQGMEQFMHGDRDKWRDMFSLGKPNLELYAKGLGAQAYTVDSPAGFTKALTDAVANADLYNMPQVIVANIDRNAEPPYSNPLYVPSKAESPKKLEENALGT
jgi:acetolactate synthase-1/2/3 large subunit